MFCQPNQLVLPCLVLNDCFKSSGHIEWIGFSQIDHPNLSLSQIDRYDLTFSQMNHIHLMN